VKGSFLLGVLMDHYLGIKRPFMEGITDIEVMVAEEVDNIAPDVYRFIHAWPPVHDVQ
jgi:hypothetical protein